MKKIKNLLQRLWTTPQQTVLPLANTSHRKYNSLDMPLAEFITALVDGDTSNIDNWSDIYMEFCQTIGGKDMEIRMEQIVERTQLETKIKLAEICINQLRLKPSREIYDALYGLGYACSVHEYDEALLEKAIKEMEGGIKSDVVDLMILNNRLKVKKGGEYSRQYFTDMLVSMGIAFKMSIPETISVRAYCVYVVKYKEYVEQMRKQAEL